jgi:hypothetical protein
MPKIGENLAAVRGPVLARGKRGPLMAPLKKKVNDAFATTRKLLK